MKKKLFALLLLPCLFLTSCDIPFVDKIFNNSEVSNDNVKITFVLNNGTDNQMIEIPKGTDSFDKPLALKEGYIFSCWCIDEKLTTEYDFSTDVKKDITLYAKYIVDYKYLTNIITTDTIKANVKIVSTTKTLTTTSSSSGSGVIFCEDNDYYYALTNNHVINYNIIRPVYTVFDYLGNEYDAEVLFSKAEYDLAIVKFKKKNSTTLKVITCSSNNISVDDEIVCLTDPLGQFNAITYGTIKSLNAKVEITDSASSNINFEVIAHSAFLNNGSSGGALLDTNLKLIGINFAGGINKDTNEFKSGYAIPINKVSEFISLYNAKNIKLNY